MHFLKTFTKKSRFFGARSPSKLAFFGAKAPLEKLRGSVSQNGYLKIVQKGDPLGRQGVKSLRSPPPPHNPLLAVSDGTWRYKTTNFCLCLQKKTISNIGGRYKISVKELSNICRSFIVSYPINFLSSSKYYTRYLLDELFKKKKQVTF